MERRLKERKLLIERFFCLKRELSDTLGRKKRLANIPNWNVLTHRKNVLIPMLGLIQQIAIQNTFS